MIEMYTEQSYIQLLKALRAEGYECASFVGQGAQNNKTVFLRHDVDWSLDYALRFAQLDAENGFRSTFAFLLRGRSYNLLEDRNREIVEKIRDLGHWITLHYPAPKSVDCKKLDFLREDIRKDFRILSNEVGVCEAAFAWHNTTPAIMELTYDFEVPGLVNIYNRKYLKDMPYRSDSNMRNSIDAFLEFIKAEHSEIHLLIHPYMWLSKGNSLIEKMLDAASTMWLEIDQLWLENRDYKAAFPEGVGNEAFRELVIKALVRKSGA